MFQIIAQRKSVIKLGTETLLEFYETKIFEKKYSLILDLQKKDFKSKLLIGKNFSGYNACVILGLFTALLIIEDMWI